MPVATEGSSAGTDPYRAAVAAIDRANADDPVKMQVDGVERPKEIVHADVVERWVRRLEPDPTPEQILAARAHHLRRWVGPRTDYPEGRAGYLRWRAEHKRRQAAEVTDILRSCGCTEDSIERVASLVAKKGLGRDPQVQTHEDALCLAFLELQLDELAAQLGRDHMISVIRKTAAKMSPEGLAAAADVPLSVRGGELLRAALAPDDAGAGRAGASE